MRTDKMLWRNRKLKKELARRLQSENPGLEVVHPHAAGIDVGNSAHYVAVRPDRDAQSGASMRVLHCRSSSIGELVARLRGEDRGLAVDGRVLDSPVRHSGRARVRGLPGQRAAHQESAGTEERCAGKPVVAEATHLRIVEQLVPATFQDPDAAYTSRERRPVCSACRKH